MNYKKIMIVLLFCISFITLSANATELNLTQKEQEWLDKNPISKVAVMDYWNFNSQGESLDTDILELINKYAGTNIIPVKFDTWKEGYLEAEKADELQGIMGLSFSEQRKKDSFYYSPPYNLTKAYLVVKNSNTNIREVSDLSNKTVLLNTKSILYNAIERNTQNTTIRNIDNIDMMYKYLAKNDDIDAVYSYYIDEEELTRKKLKVAKIIYDKYGEVAIGINHKYPELSSIINKAFKIIPANELYEINHKKYIRDKLKVNLNKEEKEWLYKKIPVRYVYDPDWAPFEWKNKLDNHVGITRDILDIISKKTGIIFEEVTTQSWGESVKLVKENRVDMYSAVAFNEERAKNMNFTRNNIFQYFALLLTQESSSINYHNEKNFINKKIGVVPDNTLTQYIQKIYPDNNFIDIKSTTNGFDMLTSNKIDLLLINAPTGYYYMSHKGYGDLKTAKKIDFEVSLKIAIQKSMPEETISIIDKALDKITQNEINEIYTKWVSVKVIEETDWVLISQISGTILLILLFILWNNHKLKQTLNEKTEEVTANLKIMDRNLIISDTDTNGVITYCNANMLKITGYTKEELIGNTHSTIRHPDTPNELFIDLWKTITSGQTWQGEIKNKRKDGGFYWVDSIISPKYNSKQELLGYRAIRYDITDTKNVEAFHKEIEDTQKEIIFTMGSIGEARSQETGNHVKRVAEYSKLFALKYGLTKSEAEMLKQASPMHDIGKIAIPDNVLNKPGRFNEEERIIMDTHVQLGYDMLKHSNRELLKMAAIVAYEHHEKWDGSGYPNQLAGENIHIYGRITALADVFDALGSDRVYKKAWDDERIFKMFKEEKGKHFDPKLIDIFFDNLDQFLEIRDSLRG